MVAVTAMGTAAAPAAAAPTATHSENLRPLANVPYQARNGTTPNSGTDIEFARLNGRSYAFAGSYRNGMQIVDITAPSKPRRVATYDCGVTQGDVQVFHRNGRTFFTYTSDTYGDGTSRCYREAAALGFDVRKPDGTGRNGTFIGEITTPSRPRTIAFVDVPQGSHNMTVHPSGMYLYNSNSDLITSFQPAIEVFDIRDMRHPKPAGELTLPPRPGLGTESHDITFNRSGSRAYSAALSQGVIIDTTDPARPKMISSFLDPSINVWHQMDPFTTKAADGTRRDFLIAEDEFAGATGTGQCPNGGIHIYDITGENEKAPVKVGYFNIDEVRPTSDSAEGRCTAHVLDIHERAQVLTMAWYNAGVRVIDLSGLAGVGLGGTTVAGAPVKEVAFARFTNSDTWAAKTNWIDPDTGRFHLYGNDMARGLDVYEYLPEKQPSEAQGQWLTARQSRELALAVPKLSVDARRAALFCLTPG